jgi:hypothetical protein
VRKEVLIFKNDILTSQSFIDSANKMNQLNKQAFKRGANIYI